MAVGALVRSERDQLLRALELLEELPGAPLARLEGRVALNILFDRYPALRTIPGEPPKFQVSPNMTGVRELPLSVG